MLTAHVTASLGWLGALAVFLAHAVASLSSQDEQIVRAACVGMGIAAWFVVLPLSLASLLTGLVQALGSAWGLFRHYWVLFKLVLTAVATSVLLLKLAPISYLADAAAQATFSDDDLIGLRTSLMIHAAGGLLVLVAAATLGLYKPSGVTRFGARKRLEEGATRTASVTGSAANTPLWAKVFGAVMIALLLLIAIMIIAGGHGPGVHIA